MLERSVTVRILALAATTCATVALPPAVATAAESAPRGIPCFHSAATGGDAVQVYYAHRPQKVPTLDNVRAEIERSVAGVDLIFNRSAAITDGTRHVRWRMDDACRLNVKVLQVHGDGPATFEQVKAALTGQPARQKALVYGDMEGDGCGWGDVWADDRPALDNLSRSSGVAVGWRHRCWDASAMAHELGHTLGAVPHSAPNHHVGGHIADRGDLMFGASFSVPQTCAAALSTLFDCGNDDYFHTAPAVGSRLDTHFNLAMSPYLEREAPQEWQDVASRHIAINEAALSQPLYGTIDVPVTSHAPPGLTADFTTVQIGRYADADARNGDVGYLAVASAVGAASTVRLDTTQVANGTHWLLANLKSNSGEGTPSAPVRVVVDNPTLSIASPPTGGTLSGTVPITAALHLRAGTSLRDAVLTIDGQRSPALWRRTAIGIEFELAAEQVPSGLHILQVRGEDDAGQTFASPSRAYAFTDASHAVRLHGVAEDEKVTGVRRLSITPGTAAVAEVQYVARTTYLYMDNRETSYKQSPGSNATAVPFDALPADDYSPERFDVHARVTYTDGVRVDSGPVNVVALPDGHVGMAVTPSGPVRPGTVVELALNVRSNRESRPIVVSLGADSIVLDGEPYTFRTPAYSASTVDPTAPMRLQVVTGANYQTLAVPLAPPDNTPEAEVVRLAGPDRYSTAVSISRDAWAAGQAESVVLARGDAFPDALAGTPLAVAKKGPLLLTSPAALGTAATNELQRVLPAGRTVYLLGGHAAISDTVMTAVTRLGYKAVRLSGSDRYATAAVISRQIGKPTTIFEATGLSFPSALVAGVAAAKVGGVVVLTADSKMPAATQTFLNQFAGVARVAVGPEAVVADPGARAIAGPDRYHTSRLLAEAFFEDATTTAIASGTVYADALAGGAHIGKVGGPLLLSQPFALPATVREYLSANDLLRRGYLYGGTVALSSYVEDSTRSSLNGG